MPRSRSRSGDSGIEQCQRVVLGWFNSRISALKLDVKSLKDSKSRLQELLQAKRLRLPVYEVIEVSGQAHDQQFVVSCTVEQLQLSGQGEGKSRKIAEQNAASILLDSIKGTSNE